MNKIPQTPIIIQIKIMIKKNKQILNISKIKIQYSKMIKWLFIINLYKIKTIAMKKKQMTFIMKWNIICIIITII